MKLVYEIYPLSKSNSKAVSRTGHRYLPKRYKEYEKAIADITRAQLPRGWRPIQGDVMIRMRFYFKKKRRGDLLNYPKSLCDALNGVLWNDDKQIIWGELSCCDKMDKDMIILEVEEDR